MAATTDPQFAEPILSMDYHGGGGGWRDHRDQRGGYRGRGRKYNQGRGRHEYADGGEREEGGGQDRGGQDRGGWGRGHRRGYGRQDRGQRGQNRDGSDRPRNNGPPRGLKGKDIGLWFRDRGKAKKAEAEIANRECVTMNSSKERRITNLLHTIRTSDNVQPQPQRSYRDPDQHTSNYDADTTDSNAPGFVMDRTGSSFSAHSDSSARSETDRKGHSFAAYSDAFHDKMGEAHNYPASSANSQRVEPPSGGARSLALLSDEVDQDEEEEDEVHHLWDEAADDVIKIEDDDEWCDDITSMTNFVKSEEEIEDLNEFKLEYLMNKEANRRSNENLSVIGKTAVESGLKRNPNLDERLRSWLSSQEDDPNKQTMRKFREKLPAYHMRKEIIDLVNGNQFIVISGETGCGKTTQVSQFILDDYIMRGEGSLCRIVCTQPRRISAISVAERVADERAEKCGHGNSVGYQIRLDSKMPRPQGSILYCTTGILLQWLRDNPYLCQVSHIILDEIHERDLLSDFLMIILKDLLMIRTDLKIILMSATLNAVMFSQYFGNCPMINIPGFTYPVEEYLLEDVIEELGFRPRSEQCRKPKYRGSRTEKEEARQKEEDYGKWLATLCDRYSRSTINALAEMNMEAINYELVVALIDHIVTTKEDGAILVFLPGWEDIKSVHKLLQSDSRYNPAAFRILPLHSMMPTINQKEVFTRPPPGVRKIVIATNIAETSITIDDVVFVIDGGKIKLKNFDAANNISTLKPEWVSKANAKQRRGRAGRVQPGICYHLYTGFQEELLQDYQLPEILRTRLEELCLQIKLLRFGKIQPFVEKAMQKPSLEALNCSIQCLEDLNALDAAENLTPLGYHLAKMPVDPHSGKMLLFGAMFGCLEPVLTVAASLSFKDAFVTPLGKESEADRRKRDIADGCQSDHIMLAKAFKGWQRAKQRGTDYQYCRENFMAASTLKMLGNMRRQFSVLLHEMHFLTSPDPTARQANINSGNEKLVKAVICAGLYPNVGKLTDDIRRMKPNKPKKVSTKTDSRAQIHPKSVNEKLASFDSRWLIYHMKMKTAKVYLYDATFVSPYPLLFFGGNISTKQDAGQDCITVDDWIVFRSPPKIASLVKELRGELDKLLEHKITNPGPTDWSPNSREGALMRAITDLITTEENHSQQ